jgi:beta-glucosidase
MVWITSGSADDVGESERTAMRRRSLVSISVLGLAMAAVMGSAAAVPPRQAATPAVSSVSAARPWLNRWLPPQVRAAVLLAQMTLEEKVDLMTGDQGAPYAFYNAPIPRLGIPALKMADAGGGVAPRGWSLPGTDGKATAMPSEMALGATWSPAVAQAYGTVVAQEVRETGQNVLLGPDTDIAREPWFGRISESEGEEPVVNGDLNSAYVNALQSDNVIATLKHYTGYNQETNRNIGQNSIIDQRTLHEIYTLAFEDVIARAHLGAVMCSYNKINGEYSCQNADTLRTILKGQLHFTGFVMTDFGALHDTLGGLQGGTDMETGTSTFYDGALLAAVQSGQASVALVNEAVLRILTTMFRIGVFDTDYTPTSIPVAAHNAVARSVEDKAITLLKNSGRALPLTGARAQSIALIGADANIVAAESGSAWVDPTTTVSTLQGIIARAGTGAVTWTPGNDPVNAASMIETSDMTTVPSSVLTPTSGSGVGLTTSYWHTPDFSGPAALTRVDKQVNYDVGFLSTFPNWAGAGTQVPIPPVNFFLEQQSVRYDGFLTAPMTGDYVLSLTGWGDATLTLDGSPIITMTGQDGRRVVDATVHLTAGVKHRLHIDYAATRPLTGLQPGTLLFQWRPPAGTESPDLVKAVQAARQAKTAIVYVRDFESEERDRVSLKLPQSAQQLIRAVSAANPNTIVVLASGGPVTMPWLGSVRAVVQTYFGGQAQGSALADVLWGDVNPSGKLTVTYPTSEQATPPGITNPWSGISDVNVVYSEGVNVGYRGYDRAGITPLFPFGYGLSYTTFRYSGIGLPRADLDGRHQLRAVHVLFRVTNTGRRAGTETAQVYLGLPASTGEPPKRLAGYAQVTLRPGQSRVVDVAIRVDSPTHPLSYYDASRQRWVTAPGTYRVYVGSSSRDIRLTGAFRL